MRWGPGRKTDARTWQYWALLWTLFLLPASITSCQKSEETQGELTGILHKGDPEFDRYRSHVELKETTMKMGLNFNKKRIVMLSGVIDNTGDRTIDVVQVKVSFYNYEKLVTEQIHTPLRPGPYTPPIKPLSQWAFSFYIEDIPKGWGASHAEMTLYGFRFVNPNE
jgi:hypothetical protein